jgi:hypothetical protein
MPETVRSTDATTLGREDAERVQQARPDERLCVTPRPFSALHDRGLVRQLSSYLKQSGCPCGPRFRTSKNGGAAGLRYPWVEEGWARYCAHACSLHQLRPRRDGAGQ